MYTYLLRVMLDSLEHVCVFHSTRSDPDSSSSGDDSDWAPEKTNHPDSAPPSSDDKDEYELKDIRTRALPDPFSLDWYQTRRRTYTEVLQVPGSARRNYPRPFLTRDADFNCTFTGRSTRSQARSRSPLHHGRIRCHPTQP
jgi:hypothetical protein